MLTYQYIPYLRRGLTVATISLSCLGLVAPQLSLAKAQSNEQTTKKKTIPSVTPTKKSTIMHIPKPKEDQFYERYFHKGDQQTDPEEYQRKKYREELEELKRIRRRQTKGKLTPVLSDEDKKIKKMIELLGTDKSQMLMAIEKLVNIGDPAVPRLRKALRSKNKQTRIATLSALRKIFAEKAIPDIQTCLNDREAEVRMEALKTLGRLRHKKSVDKVVPLLHDPKKRVRREAVLALARFKRSDTASAALINALENNILSIRKEAAQALASFESKEVVEALLRATYDEDHDIVAFAVRSLGDLADPTGKARINKLLDHKNTFIAKEARLALENF